MSAAKETIDYLETLIGYILQNKPVRDLGEAISAVRHQLEIAATAHTRGAEEMREAAALWHEAEAADALKNFRGIEGLAGCDNLESMWSEAADVHRGSATAIRQLPIPPAPEGEGK